MRTTLPIARAVSLDYEAQAIVMAVPAARRDTPTVEVLAGLVITLASLALCSLSWWMALHT